MTTVNTLASSAGHRMPHHVGLRMPVQQQQGCAAAGPAAHAACRRALRHRVMKILRTSIALDSFETSGLLPAMFDHGVNSVEDAALIQAIIRQSIISFEA
jgi:hypothetical protein